MEPGEAFPEDLLQRAEQERLAYIFRRIELGDTSVTDEVYWLQMHQEFVTRKAP